MFTPPVTKPRERDIFDEIDELMAHSRPVTLDDGCVLPHHQAKRLKNCGKQMWSLNPATGTFYPYTYHCGLHRNCPDCAKTRSDKEKERMMGALGSSGLMLTVSQEEEKATARRFKDEGVAYRRYVQSGKTLFLHDDPTLGGEDVMLYALDWDNLTQPPPGRNISGKLGAPEATVIAGKERETVTVKVESIAIEHPNPYHSEDQMRDDIRRAQELAVLKTSHLDPDAETLQSSMDEKVDALKLQLEDRGYDYTFLVCTSVCVPVDSISWHQHNQDIRKKCTNSEGMVFRTMDEATTWHNRWEGEKDWERGKSNGR